MSKLADFFIRMSTRADLPPYVKDVSALNRQISYLAGKLYREYESAPEGTDAMIRVSRWVDSAQEDDDKLLLLQSLTHFLFLGKSECEALMRSAYRDIVLHWLIDKERISFADRDFQNKLDEAARHTCFSELSDSMRIQQFHTVNNIANRERPSWMQLDDEAVCRQVEKLKEAEYRHLVILEDFVGTGGQALKVLKKLKPADQLDVLFLPLVICPQGDERLEDFTRDVNHMEYEPAFVIPWELILDEKRPKECPLPNRTLMALKKFAITHYKEVSGQDVPDENVQPFSPLGYKGTGALFAKYTNCPNNTLPLYHFAGNAKWSPLFPRNDRVKP